MAFLLYSRNHLGSELAADWIFPIYGSISRGGLTTPELPLTNVSGGKYLAKTSGELQPMFKAMHEAIIIACFMLIILQCVLKGNAGLI